jgi:hypothetical protein
MGNLEIGGSQISDPKPEISDMGEATRKAVAPLSDISDFGSEI